MSFKCKIGIHSWNGCTCTECGKIRDEQHDWKGCECSKCGKTRNEQHDWKGCVCSKCAKTRDEQHDWSKNCEECSICGITRDEQHHWKYNKCSICGAVSTVNLLPDEVVPVSGLYYCTMCKVGNSSVRNTMSEYAKSKGLNSREIESLFAQAGISSNQEVVKKNFKAGAVFDTCKFHHEATGWTLEKADIQTPILGKSGKPSKLNDKPVIEWVGIPAGNFSMGSPNSEVGSYDEILHTVTLSAFKLSKYEITFEQYDMFCEATGRVKPNDNSWGRGNRPVINVSWNDAFAFTKWMGCRLPTESEWEYACRAGTTTPFNTGNNLTTNQANYNGNFPYMRNAKGVYRGKTMPVGSFAPNSYGLYDMHGNVSEWCADWNGTYPTIAQTNPTGATDGTHHVFRGGSWYDIAQDCRSACCRYGEPDDSGGNIGFRVVLLQ